MRLSSTTAFLSRRATKCSSNARCSNGSSAQRMRRGRSPRAPHASKRAASSARWCSSAGASWRRKSSACSHASCATSASTRCSLLSCAAPGRASVHSTAASEPLPSIGPRCASNTRLEISSRSSACGGAAAHDAARLHSLASSTGEQRISGCSVRCARRTHAPSDGVRKSASTSAASGDPTRSSAAKSSSAAACGRAGGGAVATSCSSSAGAVGAQCTWSNRRSASPPSSASPSDRSNWLTAECCAALVRTRHHSRRRQRRTSAAAHSTLRLVISSACASCCCASATWRACSVVASARSCRAASASEESTSSSAGGGGGGEASRSASRRRRNCCCCCVAQCTATWSGRWRALLGRQSLKVGAWHAASSSGEPPQRRSASHTPRKMSSEAYEGEEGRKPCSRKWAEAACRLS
mmetsp:Transcript_21291/g.53041  ORF Transcript_21291/g.53041 Transcript_21291/m.53041 type:complete len:411 (+) Transcript_21291:776-2008(+)